MKHIAKYILITICMITTQMSSQIFTEGFENASQKWTQFQISGNNGFNRTTSQANTGKRSAYSYTNNASFFGTSSNEVWLISPQLDLAGSDGSILSYFQRNVDVSGGSTPTNPEQEVLYSTNYSGNGNPNLATWTVINSTTATTSWTNSTLTDQLPTVANVYIAFRYVGSSFNFFYTFTDRAWHIDDIELVSLPCSYRTVWQNNSWSNGAPNANTTAIIKSNYDTSVYGSFESCSMIIRSNATVNIRANNYIKVNNDLKVVGTLEVRHEGSLLMTNDDAIVNGNGTTNIHKTSNQLKLYDYNYWASPVINETVGDAFPTSPVQNIYYYKASDHDGQNNSGWKGVTSNTILTPALGYIALAPTSGTFPQTQAVTFSGDVNNGVISTPIELNNTSDDWNLIGNPYPSAISVDSLLNLPANSNLDKTVYLWTHNTDWINNPSGTSYTTDDYATYTPVMGGTAAKSGGAKASSYIASGQSFFINANTAGSVTFNNSMRNQHNNNQFYRAQPTKKQTTQTTDETDRIWLNMSTNDGAFSQLLIGFSEVASDDKDAYDGPSLGSGYVAFYSLINENAYAINGRSKLKDDITIPLGFTSYIDKKITIKIDIDELNGALNTEAFEVYLYDKKELINHDLKIESFAFEHENSGTYNDRFELRIRSKKTLSTESFDENNALVVYSQDNELAISMEDNEPIKSVKIYDIQGRLLFDKTIIKNEHRLNIQGIAKGTILIVQAQVMDNTHYNKKTIIVK